PLEAAPRPPPPIPRPIVPEPQPCTVSHGYARQSKSAVPKEKKPREETDLLWPAPTEVGLQRDSGFIKRPGPDLAPLRQERGTAGLYYDGVHGNQWQLMRNASDTAVPIRCCIMYHNERPIIFARFSWLFDAFMVPDHGLTEQQIEALRTKTRKESG